MRVVPVSLAILIVALATPACNKDDSGATAPEAAAEPADPIDASMLVLLDSLAAGDYAGLHRQCVDPLRHDLSKAEFDDLSAIVQWLGPVQDSEVLSTDTEHGGGQRWYKLKFSQGGPVELKVSLDASNKLIGFQFEGQGYTDAERGVIAEQWREFKVYDFHYLSPQGEYLPEDVPIAGNRVEYELVVGGIEAMLGEHHIKVEKIVFDDQGKEVFHEPIEYDTKFSEDASGIPRGVVRGHLEVPGPGQWEMDLKVTDQNAMRDVEVRQSFETVARK